MKYFRTYPWALQLLLFVLMIFTIFSLGRLCMEMILQRNYGLSLTNALQVNEHSSQQRIHIALLTQGVLSVAIFMLPALLFANLAHPQPLQYIGLKKPAKWVQPLLAVLVILGAMPLLTLLETLMSHIDFGAGIKAQQKAAEGMQSAFLSMPGFIDFLRTFTVMAIIPGIGEELFFRGMMMRFARQRSRSMVMPFIFTSVFFALAHSNYYGMPSILLAGALLAGIYYLTGSLVNGILAHIVFNGSQILLTYFGVLGTNDNSINWGLVAGGAVLFSGAFYLLWKNRTPLPANWHHDFDRPRHAETDKESSIFN